MIKIVSSWNLHENTLAVRMKGLRLSFWTSCETDNLKQLV